MNPQNRSLLAGILKSAGKFPDRPAIAAGSVVTTISYKEFLKKLKPYKP